MAIERRKDNKKRVLKEGEYQRSNGTFEYKWRDKIGKRHSIYAKTLEALRAKEEEVVRDSLEGIRTDRRDLTVNDFYDRWVELKRGLKDSTFQNYKYMYTQFVAEGFGKIKILKVKRSDVRAFYISLVDGKSLKIATVDNIHTVLHQVLQLAVEDEYIRSNPSDNALTELKKSHNHDATKRRALTLDEQNLFEEYLQHKRLESWRPIFTVMLWTGMRVGEITGLRWCDIDLDEETISVNHTLVYYNRGGGGGCGFAINTPKTEAGMRIIPMLPKVKEAFLAEKKYQEEVGLHSVADVDGYRDFIFVNRFGNTQNQSTLNKALRRIIRDCNYEVIDQGGDVTLPPFSCHSLRHTFTTRMCEAGVNIKAMQDILGHSDIQTTMDVYAEATKDLKKAELKSFADYFAERKREQFKVV